VLFELARNDLKVASSLTETMPNQAAFHAQQCAEKALKAVVWELNDTEDEDELRSRIRHDSVRAVLKATASALRTSLRNSEFYRIEGTLRKQQDTQGGRLAMILYLAASTSFDQVFRLFETTPYSKTKDYWGDSLNAELQPDPLFKEVWARQMAQAGEFNNLLMEFLFSTMDVSGSPVVVDSKTNFSALKESLQAASQDLATQGKQKEADATSVALEKISKLTDPNASLVEWMRLAIFWAPYLDAHAVRARYPTRKELTKYLRSREGVRNLVNKSGEILQQSKAILGTLKSF
jgi:hypothetical protein